MFISSIWSEITIIECNYFQNVAFFKTVISLPFFVLIRGTQYTSLSTRSIREVFFIFLVWNWFADTLFFFAFVTIAMVIYSICATDTNTFFIAISCLYFSTYINIQTCYCGRSYNMAVMESNCGNSKLIAANSLSSILNNLIKFAINLFSHLMGGVY